MSLESPRRRMDIKDFGGLVTNADPFDLPAGSAVTMQNCHPLVPGQLTARKGHGAVAFSNNASASTGNDVMAMYFFPSVIADWIIYELSDGSIKAGRAPS